MASRSKFLLRGWSGALAVLLVAVLVGGPAVTLAPSVPAAGQQASRVARHPGLTRLLAAAALEVPGDEVTAPRAESDGQPASRSRPATGSRFAGVATLKGRATGERVNALRRLGLQVRPLEHLPLAFVAGTPAQLQQAVGAGAAVDVYPNDRLEYFSAESVRAMGAEPLQAQGLTGKGIGVAIVDSGIDATHPDLADHVTHNFKVINGDYFGAPISDLIPPVLVSVDGSPYPNTDLTTGHGTHVAGIVAADGHTSPDQVGVAPDATIIGYSCGDLVFLFTQLAAFDSIMQHRQEWNIRVVNNSWGTGFGVFDPGNPINVATKAMHDAGIAVVFAAGNASEQMTLSPYAAAPWVISVGAATLDRQRAPFSSAGLQFDNSSVVDIPADDHVRFEGDSLGLYHPDVSAPGTKILSSGTPTAIGITAPTLPGGTTSLSGTSMAAPHVSGLAALLFEARPDLTPDQVRDVLQVTAGKMEDGSPFWQSGYGFADGKAALDLVRRPDFGAALLSKMQADADARAMGERPFKALSSDFWRFAAAPVSLGTDVHQLWFDVPDDTVALRMSVVYPTPPLVGLNLFDYSMTLSDANGQIVARSSPSGENGLSQAFVSLIPSVTGNNPSTPHDLFAFGAKWRVELKGRVSAADPDLPIPGLMGNSVAVVVTTLGAKPGGGNPPETGKGPEPRSVLGIPLPPLPDFSGSPSLPAAPTLPAVPLPSLPFVCSQPATPRLDLEALLGRGDLLVCVPAP